MLPIALLLVLLALTPRLLASGEIITVDEAYHWFERVATFRTAMLRGDYASTNIVGHPGVTTLWLGAMGVHLHTLLADAGTIPSASAAPALYHQFLRAPLALVAALGIGLAYPLLLRLLDRRVALLALVLWATEPFLVAHGQLLHLDSLMTTFVSLSLLAALAGFRLDNVRSPIHWGLLVGSAVAGGLALLTKSPSLILLPMVGSIALVRVVIIAYQDYHTGTPLWRNHLPQALLTLVVWGSMVALVWVALWPFAWVDVGGAIQRVVGQATHDGGSPHGWGNFFMGQAVDDPGMLFYPVVLLLRMAPWTMVGLGVAVWVVLAHFVKQKQELSLGTFLARGSVVYMVLVLFVLLFMLMMSIPPKKFDRYVLPVFPVLDIVAAWGLVQIPRRLCRLSPAATSGCREDPLALLPLPSQGEGEPLPSATDSLFPTAGEGQGMGGANYPRWFVGIVVVAVATLLWYHPYELSFYNPLLGGGRVAMHAIPVGWGEGYEQAGAFISAQPNGCDRAVATWFIPVFRASYACNPWLVPMEKLFDPGFVDYAVVYRDQVQRQNTPAATTYLQQHHTPVHTVTIHGIPYVQVYQLPQPNQYRIQADFGDKMQLVGYDVETTNVQSSGVLTLTLQWSPLAPMQQDYQLFVHVFDAAGNQVAQVDVPPGGPRSPTSAWLMHGYVSWHHPIPVPPDLLNGPYWVSIGVYEPDSFRRLPVQQPPLPAGAPDDGAGALVLPM